MSEIKKVIHVREADGRFQYKLNERISELQDEGFVVEIQYGNPTQSKYNTNVKYSAILICRKNDTSDTSNCIMVQYTQEETHGGERHEK